MPLKVVEADPDLIAAVALAMRDEDARDGMALSWAQDRAELAAALIRLRTALPGWTWVLGDDDPIAAIGVTELWPGVGQAWLCATDAWPRIAPAAARWVRRVMIPKMMGTRLHRLDTVARSDRAVAHRWLRWIGFRPAGALPSYGRAREDFVRFEMLR